MILSVPCLSSLGVRKGSLPCDLNSLMDLIRVVGFQFFSFFLVRTGAVISKFLTCHSRNWQSLSNRYKSLN